MTHLMLERGEVRVSPGNGEAWAAPPSPVRRVASAVVAAVDFAVEHFGQFSPAASSTGEPSPERTKPLTPGVEVYFNPGSLGSFYAPRHPSNSSQPGA